MRKTTAVFVLFCLFTLLTTTVASACGEWTPTPTATKSSTPSKTWTPSVTATTTKSPTVTKTETKTATSTVTATTTKSPTPTETEETKTPTKTWTPSVTASPTVTKTETKTATSTVTATTTKSPTPSVTTTQPRPTDTPVTATPATKYEEAWTSLCRFNVPVNQAYWFETSAGWTYGSKPWGTGPEAWFGGRLSEVLAAQANGLQYVLVSGGSRTTFVVKQDGGKVFCATVPTAPAASAPKTECKDFGYAFGPTQFWFTPYCDPEVTVVAGNKTLYHGYVGTKENPRIRVDIPCDMPIQVTVVYPDGQTIHLKRAAMCPNK